MQTTQRFCAVRLSTGGQALIRSDTVTAFVSSPKGLFKVFVQGDSLPFELNEISFLNLRSIVTNDIIFDCK